MNTAGDDSATTTATTADPGNSTVPTDPTSITGVSDQEVEATRPPIPPRLQVPAFIVSSKDPDPIFSGGGIRYSSSLCLGLSSILSFWDFIFYFQCFLFLSVLIVM